MANRSPATHPEPISLDRLDAILETVDRPMFWPKKDKSYDPGKDGHLIALRDDIHGALSIYVQMLTRESKELAAAFKSLSVAQAAASKFIKILADQRTGEFFISLLRETAEHYTGLRADTGVLSPQETKPEANPSVIDPATAYIEQRSAQSRNQKAAQDAARAKRESAVERAAAHALFAKRENEEPTESRLQLRERTIGLVKELGISPPPANDSQENKSGADPTEGEFSDRHFDKAIKRALAGAKLLELLARLAAGAVKPTRYDDELIATRQLFGLLLPEVFERHFQTPYEIRRNAKKQPVYSPGPQFVFLTLEAVGLKNRKGESYSYATVVDYRLNALQRARANAMNCLEIG